MRAAFVALTVAGQQGHSPLSMPAPPFWIFDCRFWIGIESKIQNLKSKIGGGCREGESPLSLNPSAADYLCFITSLIRSFVVCSSEKGNRVLAGSLEKTKNKPRLIPTSPSPLRSIGGKIGRPFSLFRRGRLKNALGRFPGLGFNLLAAPSHPD